MATITKKAQKKKNERVIEDQTFGLKNKNKSKKVQEFIERVEKTVKNSQKGKDVVRSFNCLQAKCVLSCLDSVFLGEDEGGERSFQNSKTIG